MLSFISANRVRVDEKTHFDCYEGKHKVINTNTSATGSVTKYETIKQINDWINPPRDRHLLVSE